MRRGRRTQFFKESSMSNITKAGTAAVLAGVINLSEVHPPAVPVVPDGCAASDAPCADKTVDRHPDTLPHLDELITFIPPLLDEGDAWVPRPFAANWPPVALRLPLVNFGATNADELPIVVLSEPEPCVVTDKDCVAPQHDQPHLHGEGAGPTNNAVLRGNLGDITASFSVQTT
jgi:hypothetical protein